MKLSLAVVADAAHVDQNQKLTVFGVFDTIVASAFPAVHPSMTLALRFAVEHRDSGKTHDVRIRLLTEDGAVMIEGSAQLQIAPVGVGALVSPSLAITINGLVLPGPGRYHFEVESSGLDDSPGEVPFIVALAPAPAAQ